MDGSKRLPFFNSNKKVALIYTSRFKMLEDQITVTAKDHTPQSLMCPDDPSIEGEGRLPSKCLPGNPTAHLSVWERHPSDGGFDANWHHSDPLLVIEQLPVPRRVEDDQIQRFGGVENFWPGEHAWLRSACLLSSFHSEN
jgi:hypothetical protein